MAGITFDPPDLVVALGTAERVGALRTRDVRVPLASVTSVRATDDPWAELRGIRAPGTGVPGVISLCTRVGQGFRDFAAVYGRGPAVVIETDGADFDRLVISCRDPGAQVRRIDRALGGIFD